MGHDHRSSGPSPFLDGDPEREQQRPAAQRRTFLKVAGAGGASLLFSAAAGAPAQAAPKSWNRAYVLVVDGCRPDEIDSGFMPNLRALRDGGFNFPRGRSMPILETIPNHVMMMTGVRPDRSGVPANSIFDRTIGEERTLDRPGDLVAPTLLWWARKHGLTAGTVLSKEYLYGIFGRQATFRWEPRPIVPISGHAPDAFTMDAALSIVEQFDPHLVFVNLGDVDRVGHTDLTGGLSLEVLRRTALVATDQQVKRFVDMLKATGRWEKSMLVVLADHSMDWSLPHKVISLTRPLEADPLLRGKVAIAQNGGADLLYWTGPASGREAGVRRMLQVAAAQPGVLSAHDRVRTPSLRLGPNAGDVIVYCQAGWRFSDPSVVSNPIPGNHGHPATGPIPFFLSGGHPAIRRGSSSEPAYTVDVTPTVAKFLGLPAMTGRTAWDGKSLLRW
ncbi:alkaline phosphatase family protein [Nocardioides sp. ChNu-153]|uniref:alkaline phosphatase family protein n=1 Tax=unclassified Nocardioides TaxID=2615069 RepID=UPI002404EBF6|nr:MULTISPECIES: alkaline phosphatase family protein [unclassified Nocardioides]MDN7122366.1 alkaline phosphatase family protein [Nocardioides sp. ChNu-153]